MAFGAATGKIKEDIEASVEIAEMYDATGKITGMTSYGGKTTTTTEEFTDDVTTGDVTNGQSGEITQKVSISTDAQGYARKSVTKVKAI